MGEGSDGCTGPSTPMSTIGTLCAVNYILGVFIVRRGTSGGGYYFICRILRTPRPAALCCLWPLGMGSNSHVGNELDIFPEKKTTGDVKPNGLI